MSISASPAPASGSIRLSGAAAAKRFAVVLHDIDADRRGQADALTTSVDFEDHVMDGFAALNRYIVERSPHRRFQPNAGLMIADPDVAARRRSLAVASLPCFHVPENTAPNQNRDRTSSLDCAHHAPGRTRCSGKAR